MQHRPRRVAFLRLLARLPLIRRQTPRELRRPHREQPLVERDGRAAVFLVVRADLLEERVVPRLGPLLEEDDGLGAAGHLGRALEAVELLDRP